MCSEIWEIGDARIGWGMTATGNPFGVIEAIWCHLGGSGKVWCSGSTGTKQKTLLSLPLHQTSALSHATCKNLRLCLFVFSGSKCNMHVFCSWGSVVFMDPDCTVRRSTLEFWMTYHGGEKFKRFFFRMTKIKGVKKLVLLLRNEGNFWYDAPCCCFLVDVQCGFLAGSGWLLLFPGDLWMIAVISWWALDGYCHFLVGGRTYREHSVN